MGGTRRPARERANAGGARFDGKVLLGTRCFFGEVCLVSNGIQNLGVRWCR
jgi:hypothetical protein